MKDLPVSIRLGKIIIRTHIIEHKEHAHERKNTFT